MGGRTWTKQVKGVPVDVGGQWIGPQQKRIAALAAQVGVKTFPTYNTGLNVYDRLGTLKTYTGAIPPAETPAIADIAVALGALNEMAGEVPLAAPWKAPRAREWDGQTLETWKLANMTTEEGRLLLDLGVEAVFAGEPRDVSLLHVLFYIHSAGSFDNLINTAGGAQESRFVGGSQLVSRRVAKALGSRVVLSSPVRRIDQRRRHVVVESDRVQVTARYCVVTAPPALAGTDRVSPRAPRAARPAHPADADGLGAQVPCALRQAVLARRRPHRPGHERHGPGEGHLRQLASRPEGRASCSASSRARRRASGAGVRPPSAGPRCSAQFARWFGSEARSPQSYIEQNWMEEAWSRGCYGAWAPPGVLLDYGAALTAPVGRIHWAGTETATEWCGYMDGAVRSGERVAAELHKLL